MGRMLLVGLAVIAMGCSDSRPPTSPSPSTPSTTVSTSSETPQTVTGVTFESTQAGIRPLANVGLDVTVEYQSWPPQFVSGADGRYQATGLSYAPAILKIRAEKTGYSQPCGATFAPASGASVLNIYLVANDTLATTGVPPSMPITLPAIAGVVVEQMADGRKQPISGASVIADFSGGLGWAPNATTVSDANGRYVLCGLSATLGIDVWVTKNGFAQTEFPPALSGGDFTIVMKRQQ